MLCRFPPRKTPVSNTERRFWLRLYSDEEIALMAEALTLGEFVANRAEIRAWRERLEVEEPNGK